MPVSRETLDQIKKVIRESLKLDADAALDDSMPLIGGDYDLDSLDILLVVTNLEKQFGIRIPDKAVGRSAFASIETLGEFVESQKTKAA